MHILKNRNIAILICLHACSILCAQAADKMDSPDSPTMADVKYGPHKRNVPDFCKAKSDKPTPVALYVHPGDFEQVATAAEHARFALYDLKVDPGETHVLSTEHPQIYQDLKQRHIE